MSRAVDGKKRKSHRKAIVAQAKGFWGRRHSNYKTAKDAVVKSLAYAYRDRRDRKPAFRRLWIARINAACRLEGISYSRFIEGLHKTGIIMNRKLLAETALNDRAVFVEMVKKVQAHSEA